MNNAEMNIKLSANNAEAVVSLRRADGQVNEKSVSVEDLTASLARTHVTSTGILPINTRYFKGDRNRYVVAIESPAKQRRFMLEVNRRRRDEGEGYEPEELTVPFPNCLFVFKIDRRRIMQSDLYALERRLGTDDDTLCRFPYGNVFDHGNICWGYRGELPETTTPNVLTGVINRFFDLPYNGDLTNGIIFNASAFPDGVTDFWSLVRHMAGQTIFPAAGLHRTGRTFRDVVDSFQFNQ